MMPTNWIRAQLCDRDSLLSGYAVTVQTFLMETPSRQVGMTFPMRTDTLP